MIKARTLARRLALQYCFMCDLNAEWNVAALPDFLRDHCDSDKCREFAAGLIDEVIAEREALDQKISAALQNWDLARVAAVERNLLRVAAAELARKNLDKKIIISEAIFLAENFGDKNSAKFVGGILSAIAE